MKFNVFGRPLLIVERSDGWAVFHVGAEGKRRPAHDLIIPGDIAAQDIQQYLADICHEWATNRYPNVQRLD